MVPRDFWLEDWEKAAIITFHAFYRLEGYRRLTYMMLDADVVAVSGTDHGIQASFERMKTARGTDDRGCFVSSAHSSAPRHAVKNAESARASNMAWQSLARTGRPGVRAC
jgi:hypothetical protein